MRCGLQRLARRLRLSDRVVFEGHLGVDEIWSSNHALVMPSRYEGLPLAIIEAKLCGRPVIATDVAGHGEIIEDGVTGFPADAPTCAGVGHALERFWARKADAKEIGATAAKRIRQLVPPDPVRVFADKLATIVARAEPACSRESLGGNRGSTGTLRPGNTRGINHTEEDQALNCRRAT